MYEIRLPTMIYIVSVFRDFNYTLESLITSQSKDLAFDNVIKQNIIPKPTNNMASSNNSTLF